MHWRWQKQGKGEESNCSPHGWTKECAVLSHLIEASGPTMEMVHDGAKSTKVDLPLRCSDFRSWERSAAVTNTVG